MGSFVDQPKPAQIFISYAHEDTRWMEKFVRMLAPGVERGLVSVWSDENIEAGEKWFPNINKALESAQIGLLLVTDHFLQSEFIKEHELKKLLDLAETSGVSIRWVPVSPSLSRWTELGEIQACWPPDKPLKSLLPRKQGDAIKEICDEIVGEFGEVGAARKLSLSRAEGPARSSPEAAWGQVRH
jgi:hypothetical protein